ncbi:hypothetical protein, partial [Stenotrophomonas maltophilia]|uniref:hypothetical protein n=1 Tax=Stenotrophomonas maltophilia TaxID=40324 RepID=UPI001A7E0B8F
MDVLRSVALARLIQKRWVERKQEGVGSIFLRKTDPTPQRVRAARDPLLIFFLSSVAGSTRKL